MQRFFLGVAAALFLVGCGGGFDTNRDAAQAIAEALCARFDECEGLTSSEVADCESAVVGEVCRSGNCNDEPSADNDDIDRCIDEIEVLSCSAQDLPGLCIGIL